MPEVLRHFQRWHSLSPGLQGRPLVHSAFSSLYPGSLPEEPPVLMSGTRFLSSLQLTKLFFCTS